MGRNGPGDARQERLQPRCSLAENQNDAVNGIDKWYPLRYHRFMFDYKQRPFGKAVTDEIYDRAVGRAPSLVSASASGSLTSPLVMPNEQPCAETGCYWDQLPVP